MRRLRLALCLNNFYFIADPKADSKFYLLENEVQAWIARFD